MIIIITNAFSPVGWFYIIVFHKLYSSSILIVIKSREKRCVDHVARMGTMRNTETIFIG
jgi:hypothetical protein